MAPVKGWRCFALVLLLVTAFGRACPAAEVRGQAGVDLRIVSVDTFAFLGDGDVRLVRMKGVSGVQAGQACRADLRQELDGSGRERCGLRALRWLAVKLRGDSVSCELRGDRRVALVRAAFGADAAVRLGGDVQDSPGAWIGAEAAAGWCWSRAHGDLGRMVVAAGWAQSRHSRYGGAEGWARTHGLGGWGEGGFGDPEAWLARAALRSARWWEARR